MQTPECARAIRLPACIFCTAAALWGSWLVLVGIAQPPPDRPVNRGVRKGDWPQLGGTPHRNNVADKQTIPTEWDIKTGQNIKWSAPLGSQTYGSPVVANGHIYVGTNNGGRVGRDVLLCLRESDGTLLWQYSCPTPPRSREIHLCQIGGLCSSPVVEGDRLWFVTNRAEVICLDTEGFRDGENDGPFVSEKPADAADLWDEQHEADVVWSFDMLKELNVQQHNQLAICSPTIWGDVLFICTCNGVSENHKKVPAPDAPSFLAMDKNSGKVLWTDNSPGENIMYVQWSSPAIGVFDGVPQVIFGGGDGWLYSFRADRSEDGRPILLWKFDANPKGTIDRPKGGRRIPILAAPVIHDGLVYAALGHGPEGVERPGHLWCVDPTKHGDVSAELVVDEVVVPNPQSAVVWHYSAHDQNGNGKLEFDETMHCTLGGPAIKNGLLFIADASGLIHCLDARSGKQHWTCDLLCSTTSTQLIVDDRVYVADTDGAIAILSLSADLSKSTKMVNQEDQFPDIRVPLRKIDMELPMHTTPIAANGVLYIATDNRLFAIAPDPQKK